MGRPARRGGGVAGVGRCQDRLLGTLEDIPDTTLVEVVDGADLVRIVKRGRYLVVRVIDGADDLSLEVSVPIRTARRTAALVLG